MLNRALQAFEQSSALQAIPLIFNLCNEPWFYNQENLGFASQASAPVKAWIQRVSKAGILAMTGTN